MKKWQLDSYTGLGFLVGVLLTVVALVSCGGGSTSSTPTTGTVNVSMTDPATCNGPTGFSHIYVTVTKVTANINPDASSSDSGWQTLVDLTNSPMQIDLLSLANPTQVCLLKMLGSSGPLPAGKYQQIRLYLLSNTPSQGTATPGTNACGSGAGWNCVETQSGTFSELQLPSEVQTGIKIPSTNIVSGGMTVTASQSVDLNIDFQSCESIVQEGNGQYRLKPVLFAGETSQNLNSISGTVVAGTSSGGVLNSSSPTPIAGATVLFEQATNGVETVVDSTTTDSNGNFFVCPLQGTGGTTTYDVVVSAQTSGAVLGVAGTVTYNPTVAFDVPLGTNLNQIPLVPETASTASTGGAATISGQVDTSTGTSAIAEDVALFPTMSLTPASGTATAVIIPVFTANGSVAISQPPAVTTSTAPPMLPPPCAANSGCNNFSLTVPASNANVGTMSNGSITYGVVSASSVTYSLTAASGSCSSSPVTASSIVVTPDKTTNLSSPLSLSGCS